MLCTKIIKIGQRFTELFKKLHWHLFLRRGVVVVIPISCN